jgi:hypothetical protein
MSTAVDELWALAQRTPHVDADALARAVEAAVTSAALDYRSRLLVRDSVRALERYWGRDRFARWLAQSPGRASIEDASVTDGSEQRGFPNLQRRVMDVVQPEQVERFLRDLSRHVSKPTRLVVGGSTALILAGLLSRSTDDVDVVDEVPAELRANHRLVEEMIDRYGLRLAHFQSHYLPDGWDGRVRSMGAYGNLRVFGVDPIDIFVGKLFSVRAKDRDDLNALVSQLDHQAIRQRVKDSAGGLRSEARLLDAAKQNWFVLFGESDLPA